jgi:hypothetical protein
LDDDDDDVGCVLDDDDDGDVGCVFDVGCCLDGFGCVVLMMMMLGVLL